VFILQTYLAISNADMSEDIQMFFESVLDLIHIKRQKNKKVDEDDEEIKNTSDLEYEDEEEEIEDRLEFCVPQCRYCVSSDGGCDLQVGHNVHIDLSQDEI